MASIEFQSVSKGYVGHANVIRDVNLHIGQGEFCVFVGPSGCGKSTLLRMIAGLEEIGAGELLIGGERMNDVPAARRGVAMVFQSYALFPHMTVRQNLSFGMNLAKLPPPVIAQRVAYVARLLQLDELLDRKPRGLSGGQRQRVAIGRAIVREPGVFLFDEPLSNLDASLRVQMRFEIARLHREFGQASTVYVTHDQVEAMTLADRIVVLNAGATVQRDGSVAQCGTPLDLYHRPRNLFVAGFIGSPRMNLLPGTLLEGHAAHALVRLDSGETVRAAVHAARLCPGERVTLGVRPEQATLGDSTQHLTRPLLWQERLGETTYLYFEGTGKEPIVVKAAGDVPVAPGARLAVALPADCGHVFDAEGVALERTAQPG
ncbi:ABC transporter ATP-binding protein [Piscinibacter sp.]|uniref:ABC transporter ATP-binding protein n=1 Tax=Piscinibacter sp. TaxID=1903157 RepID=UPI002C9C22D6|nr:sn-glycerol-3-phosphate ABC transporter ATP-binding protein UgpC [Albitalea sp.]HUG24548.1 sn-glycerol-3-phosphate ABC transporter ATP-binding protein UgpC [Albitalea sp.]